MNQQTLNKIVNPASLPYGQLLEELLKENCRIQFSPVIEYTLNINKVTSALTLMASFADSMKDRFKAQITARTFNSMVNIASELNMEVKGKPTSNITAKTERPFFGCQVRSGKTTKIYLSYDLSFSLARATIAHEIMHKLFATVNENRPGNLPSDYVEEVLCDYGAARFLVQDSYLRDELTNSLRENIADKIVYLSKYFSVPRNYIAYRIFDALSSNNLKHIAAIIEWKAKQPSDRTSLEIVASWGVSLNGYIPFQKDKPNHTRAREGSIIHTAFWDKTDDADFVRMDSEEAVSFGSLKGNFKIYVCAIGKLESNSRVAISVLVPVK